ncbi:amidase [Planomicrobium soli]|uniref:Amidase n=1 Tax=Planomicrobium soli TaxID=1176648 RepID=A0A2P8H5T0_9BACL|nr:amidase family protein [Planomicrobium soli]PSL41544.1 amidase [Planomicrobium soli]
MHLDRLKEYRLEKLDDLTIAELQKEMEDGVLTSEELVLMFHENISERDKGINSIIEVNPDALIIAQALDMERKISGPRSVLHGIPILLKDNIGTGDKMHTSAGSYALKDYYAEKDAVVAAKLRKAGAVLLGKTHMTEWADMMSEDMPDNYCSRSGHINHPFGDFYIGGSSSGSAAAIAMSLAAASIGTETSGSIINPSDENSLVGIKPTLGLTSRSGIIPLAASQDIAGPMARNVTDAVTVFSAIIGWDAEDEITVGAKPYESYDWLAHLKKDGLQGVRLAVPRHLFEESITANELDLFNEALDVLRSAGAELIDPVDIGVTEEEVGDEVQYFEFKPNINEYLGKSHPSNPIRSLDDLIAFHNKHPEKMLRYGQSKLEKSNATSGRLNEPEYVEALKRKRLLAGERGIMSTLEELKASAFVLPKDFGGSVGATAGMPLITVPYSFEEENGPFGITFMGPAFSDPALIEFAYAFEQATDGRVKPSYK